MLARFSSRRNVSFNEKFVFFRSCTSSSENSKNGQSFAANFVIVYTEVLETSEQSRWQIAAINYPKRVTRGAHFHAEAHISTQPPSSVKDPRLPGPYEDQERRGSIVPAPGQGPPSRVRQRGLPRLERFRNYSEPSSESQLAFS